MYVNWVVEEIKRDRSQFDGFQKGRGIIATRERFLKWMQSHDGQSASKLAKEEAPQDEGEKKFGKTIIVPVAIPGVGRWSSGAREQCSHVMLQARPQLRLHYRTFLDLVILKATMFTPKKLRAPLLRMSLNYSRRMHRDQSSSSCSRVFSCVTVTCGRDATRFSLIKLVQNMLPSESAICCPSTSFRSTSARSPK